MTWNPTYLKDLTAWIANSSIPMYGRWNHPPPAGNPNAPGEGGVDLTAPQGTPVYALATGPIVGAGYWNDANHGVITQRVNVPGVGVNDLYYQHITLDPSIAHCASVGTCNQTITKGQQIGTVGAFGETEMGFNANWGTIWGDSHPSGTVWPSDPRPWIAALMTGNAPAVTSTDTSTTGGGSSSGGGTIADWQTQFHTEGTKIGLFLLAFILAGFGVYMLFQKQINGAITHGAKAAVKAAVV